MDNRPVGVIDSGVGGITTVREMHRILPGEDIIYFGDTGRVPYGTRSGDTIRKYAVQEMRYLSSFGVKAIVIACGTISSNIASDHIIRAGLDVPYTGVVIPAAKAACAASKSGRIGVMATSATINSGAYGGIIRSIHPDAELIENAAPLLVPLVENGMTDTGNKLTRLALEMYLEPFLRQKTDTLILGCTHYPLLMDMIEDMLGGGVKLIDSGAEAAKELKAILTEKDILADREKGDTAYRVTDSVEIFASVARAFLFCDIAGQTEYVDIDLISSL